jgi:glycosyltransferase involved in cell wall biosynthesis
MQLSHDRVPCEQSEPLVSVIMIFYEAERFIVEAIESVISQTYSNWELLLVDDGSTDRGTSIAKAYVSDHPRKIKYLQHPGHANCGMGASRSLGLLAARGEYAAFLDADDVYMRERIELHIKVLEENPDVGIVVSHDLYWFSWNKECLDAIPWEADYVQRIGVMPGMIIEPPELLALVTSPGRAAPIGIHSFTFRDLTIDSLGGSLDQFKDQYEDQSLLARLLLKQKAIVLDECLAKYRQHDASLTAKARERGEYADWLPAIAEETYLRWLKAYVDGQGVAHAYLDRALDKRLFRYDYPTLGRVFSLSKKLVRDCAWSVLALIARLHPSMSHQQLLQRVRSWRWWWRQRRTRRAATPTARCRTSGTSSTDGDG